MVNVTSCAEPKIATPGSLPAIEAALHTVQRTRGRARQFWRAFERSPVPMVAVDGHKRYQGANAPARLVFRLALADWRSRRIEDLTPPDMVTTLETQWGHLLVNGFAAGRFDCQLPDGSRVPIVYRALANVLPGEHLIAFLPASFSDDELAAFLEDEPPYVRGPLTGREREVLTLIANGDNSAAIAEELSISVQTVRTHTRNALRKLGARNRSHAIAIAMQLGLIDVSIPAPADEPSAN